MRAGSPGRGLAAAFVDWRGPGIATCAFHERRIYETLETECDRMCHVVDLRRTFVCAIANRRRDEFIRYDELCARRLGSGAGKLVRGTDRNSAFGLPKRGQCIERALLR